MKKFLLFLVFLIILGGTAFFFGWAQLTVPPGSYGIIRSKTHGLETQVIRDGEFRWIWYKLIPTNVKISVYTINPVKRSIRSSGNLSSGQVYASTAGIEADFSWEISGELSFSLKPEFLPDLTARESIADDEGLRIVEGALAARIENLVLERIRKYANDETGTLDTIVFASSLPELNREIESLIPEIENFSCTIQNLRLPDYALYQSVKSLYQEYMARQSAVLALDITREAERRINSKIRLEELTQYGELLTKYPILIEYLAVEKEIQGNRADIYE